MNELVCLKKVSLLLHRRYIQKSIVTWKLVFFFCTFLPLPCLQIYTLYGYHLAKTSYFICHDAAKIKAMFDRIRTLGVDGKYPTNCGPYEIRFIRDLTTGTTTEGW